mgnify:CR=1 FL=1
MLFFTVRRERLERQKEREQSRANIYNFSDNVEKLITMHVSVDAECELDEDKFMKSISDKFVTKYVFGWFRTEGKYTKHKPSLEMIESYFKQMIRSPLVKLLNIDKIYADRSKIITPKFYFHLSNSFA